MGTNNNSNILGNYKPYESNIQLSPKIIKISCPIVEKLYINQTELLEFKVLGENSKYFGRKLKIVLKSSDPSIKLIDSHNVAKTDFTVEKGWKFSVYVKGTKLITNGKIELKVDDTLALTIPISVHNDKDIFSLEEIKRLRTDVKNLGLTDNACICVADARISELLNDQVNFMNKKRQKMSNGHYINRLKYLQQKGFVTYGIKEFNYKKKDNAPYVLITSIKEEITKEISNRIGYHVYYISLLDDVHVLTLVINNSDPCNTKFQILDQGTQWENPNEEDILMLNNYFEINTLSLYFWYKRARNIEGAYFTRIAKIKRL